MGYCRAIPHVARHVGEAQVAVCDCMQRLITVETSPVTLQGASPLSFPLI